MSEIEQTDLEIAAAVLFEYEDCLSNGSWPSGTQDQSQEIADFLCLSRTTKNAYFADRALLLILEYQAPIPPAARQLLAEAARARLKGKPGGTPMKANRHYWQRTAYYYMARLIYHGTRLEDAARMAARAVDLGSVGEFCFKASTLEHDYTARWRSTGSERWAVSEFAAHAPPDDPQWLEVIKRLPTVTTESRIGKRR